MVDFKKVNAREQAKKVHQQMQEPSAVGNIALWNGRGKVQFRGEMKFGEQGKEVKYGVVVLLPDPEKGPKKYIYSGMITILDPRNKPADGSRPKKFFPEERIGNIFIYEDDKDPSQVYGRLVLDNSDWFAVSFYQTSDDDLLSNPRLPIITGSIYEKFKEDEEASQQQATKRAAVRKTIGAQNESSYVEELDGNNEQSRVEILIECLNDLTEDEFDVVCKRFYLVKGDWNKQPIKEQVEEEPDIEYISTPSKEDYQLDIESEGEDEEDSNEITWDDEPLDNGYEKALPLPAETLPKPRRRIAEVARETKQADRVKTLMERMKEIGSNLVDGIDEEELV